MKRNLCILLYYDYVFQKLDIAIIGNGFMIVLAAASTVVPCILTAGKNIKKRCFNWKWIPNRETRAQPNR